MLSSVKFYGLGAIGSNLLLQLAKQQPRLKYFGYDFDKVEPRNIGPQAYFLSNKNQPKVHAMRAILSQFLTKVDYVPVDGKITQPLVAVPTDTLVVDCFDNTASRRLLTQASGHVFHVGFSPQYTAEGLWSPEYDAPGDIPAGSPDICTLPDAVSFIHLVVNTACLTLLDFILTGEKKGFIVTPKSGNRVPTIREI